jgi:hypothetical protein
MPSLPSRRVIAGHRLPRMIYKLFNQQATTIKAHPGGSITPLEIGSKQIVIPVEIGLRTRHSKSIPALPYYKNDYSRDSRVKQVTFITIFIRLVVLFF